MEALDERAAEAAQGEGEGDPQQRGRWSKLRPHTHRRVPAPASAAPKLPNFGKAGGEADSWTRGLRARRIWGLRYLPAVASIWYLDMRGGINPFLASSVVEPAGMIGSIYAFTLGPAAWWATQFAKGKAYATRVRAVLALSASGVGYMGGPTTVGWLYNHGIDASMWTPFGAGIATTAALWWFLDRRTYRLPWLFGWVPLIPTSAVAYATASFVIDF
ncbi:hypothetical protein ACIQF5_20825 [Streptomyces goshikiensis]|uniref:hypothetical protein n=1 Tax=Streptomyces goshikiensis TaxID=1942 RepID=UPI0037F1E67D